MTDAALAAELSDDIAVFADIGTEAPTVELTPEGHVVRFVRHGQVTELLILGFDAIVEKYGDSESRHANFKALLASERYGNIRDWANKQTAFLSIELERSGELIEVHGLLDKDINPKTLNDIDDHLIRTRAAKSAQVLLIDGPAGIGKTQFILSLAAHRAKTYTQSRRPLVLHVQSRGKQLSYILDLIAFNLQRLRIDVTYDQVPILAKYGLITVAIDGFDELADPDGYDLAWSQVNDLVAKIRGSGTMILAGRETFIGRDRALRDLPTLRPEVDDLAVLTLQPPTKGEALNWLQQQGWPSELIDSVESFFEPSSLALRPFFLKTLSDPAVARRISTTSSTNVLSILMEAMIDREATKFGEPVERELNEPNRRWYVKNLMEEVARDIAENASVAVSDATLAWLVDVALPMEPSDNVKRILKARSQAIAFLTNDDRPGYRRFFHEKFYEYFLAVVLLGTLGRGEISKPLARNIFGTSFLETFNTIISSGTPTAETKRFLNHSLKQLETYPPIDRTRKNIGALLIASLAVADVVENFEIASVEIDQARFVGTAESSSLKDVIVSQLDCRGADLAAVQFDGCQVFTLIADEQTRLPDSFPTPHLVQDMSSYEGGLSNPAAVTHWREQHLANPPEKPKGLVPEQLRDHPAVKLLSKACRLRQYWLRRGDDIQAARILDDENWAAIEKLLGQHNLLRVEFRQASGTNARFLHIRQPLDILTENERSPEVVGFYRDLVTELRG